MKLYRLAALPLAGVLILGPVLATPAFAAHPTKTSSHTAKSTGRASAHAKKPTARPVPFTAVGTLSAVDSTGATVVVAVRSGNRDLRGHSVTVTISTTAKIRLNDAAATLDTLPVGSAVTLVGTRTGDVLTATKVLARTTTSG